MREQSGVTGVNIISLKEAWGHALHGHEVVSIFHLVGGFHICKATQEVCLNTVIYSINPEYSLEGLMVRAEAQYFGHLV